MADLAYSLPERLQEIAPFAALGAIAECLNLTLTLRGGAASRATMYAIHRPLHEVDLFDLVPFSSDVDLEHSGGKAETLEIAKRIEDTVDFASWVRWSISDAETAAAAAAQRERSTWVPLRRIAFATDGGFEIPDEAISDLFDLRVTVERRAGYLRPTLAGAVRDLEIFGLLMGLNVQAEMADIADASVSVSPDPRDWIDGASSDFEELAGSPNLAARFWRLLAMRIARTGLDDDVTARLLSRVREYRVLEHFPATTDVEKPLAQTFSVSGWASGNRFRVPELTPELLTGHAAHEAALELLDELQRISNPESRLTALPIDPAFELVAFVPELTIEPQDFESEADDPFESGVDQEFLEIAWRCDPAFPLNHLGLTAQLVPRSLRGLVAEPLPAVGGVFGDYAWVRTRIGSLVGTDPGQPVKAGLLILQVQP